MSATARPRSTPPKRPLPVLRLTFYDRFSSFMVSTVFGLLIAVLAIIAWWSGTRRHSVDVTLRRLEIVPGGVQDGAPGEMLHVESPDEPTPNASPVEEQMEERKIEQTLESVVELADRATQQVQQLVATDAMRSGTPGSADATDRRPLGDPRRPDFSGVQRWFIRFADEESVDKYAAQLDYFGIELGALFPARGELIYLSNLSDPTPSKRVVTGGNDQRLYMSWRGSGLKAVDAELFQRAGVDVSGAIVLHFYPRQTEDLLARKELAAANRPVGEIRRTYFVVIEEGDGYSFSVTHQTFQR